MSLSDFCEPASVVSTLNWEDISQVSAKMSAPESSVRDEGRASPTQVSSTLTINNVKATASEPKKNRAGGKHQMAACTACKRKRKKCDGKYPRCGGCLNSGSECTVFDYTTSRIIPRNYIQLLEEKIAQQQADLKTANASLSQKVESASSSNANSSSLVTESTTKRRKINDSTGSAYEQGEEAEEKRQSEAKDRDLEMEIGFITLGVGAESKYIGNSSAFSIAKAITRSIDYYAERKDGDQSAPNPSPSGSSIMDADKAIAVQVDLYDPPFTRPPMNVGRLFLTHYNDIVQCQYPFLDWEWIEKAFTNVMVNDSENFEELFFIYMIFAIGSRLVSTNLSTMPYTKVYHKKAMDNIGPLVEFTTLKTVQAYLLLAMFSQKMPEGSSIWQISGLAIRSATVLGLHREPFRRNKSDMSPEVQKLCEMKARIFWSAYGIERINGIVLGRPFGIADSDIDAPLPQETPELEVAIHVIKLRRLQASICSFVYKPKPLMDSPEEIDSTRVQIVLELNEWVKAFPAKSKPVSAFETKSWCQISYHNSLLLLLRPMVLEVSRLKERSSPRLLEWFKVFAQSASAICMNYKDLLLNNKLGYTWLSLHCLFVSGLSFAYCLWIDCHMKVLDWKRRSLIYDTISSCSQILFVFAEKFSTATMFRDTFGRIAKVVLMKLEGEDSYSVNDHSTADAKLEGRFSGFPEERQDTPLSYNQGPTSGIINEQSIGINQYLDFGKDVPLFSFTAPQQLDGVGSSQKYQKESQGGASAGNLAMPDMNEEVWEFLDTTGDKFLRDIFYDLETQLGL